MGVARTLRVDRSTYEVEVSDGVSRAWCGDLELRLPPWSGADHFRALERHLVPGVAGLELDAEGYAAELLSRTDVPVEHWGELVSLALWWATRPELDGELLEDGRLGLPGGARAQLERCTWKQRLAAVRGSLQRSENALAVDPVAVVERLVDSVSARVEDASGRVVEPRMLEGAALARLVEHVVEHSTRESPFPELEGLEEVPARAGELLAVCRALGRTPTEVLALPALEIDLVRALLRVESGEVEHRELRTSRPHAPLHDAIDAVVLEFGDGDDP